MRTNEHEHDPSTSYLARRVQVLRAHHAPLLACNACLACLEKTRKKCGTKTEAGGDTADCLEKSKRLDTPAMLARRSRRKIGVKDPPPSPLGMSFNIQGKTHAMTWIFPLTPSPPSRSHSSLSIMVLSSILVGSKVQIYPRMGHEQRLRRAERTLVARSSLELEGRGGRHAIGTHEAQRSRERSGRSVKKRVDRTFFLVIISFGLMVMSAVGLAWSRTTGKGSDFLFPDYPQKLEPVLHTRMSTNRHHGGVSTHPAIAVTLLTVYKAILIL